MAFFDKSNSIPVKSNFLNYNYPPSNLFNKGQWQQKNTSFFSSQFFYQITYPTDSVNSNKSVLTHTEKGIPRKYKPYNMFLYGVLHDNITGLTSGEGKNPDIIGELVIQNVSDNSDKKIYLCVFLQKSSGMSITTTSIDSIIKMINSDPLKTTSFITSVELNLTQDIPPVANQKCIVYKDINNTVIILTEPIMINSVTANIIANLDTSTDLFKISAPNNYINETKEEAGAKLDPNADPEKKNDTDDIYIDCKPTGVSDNEIQTYQLPINSSSLNDIQKMDFMKTSVNFFLFAMGIGFIFMGVPVLYKMVVIDNILKNNQDDYERKKLIRSADIIIATGVIIFVLGSFYNGFQGDGDYQMITNGLFGFVLLGLSVSLILTKKLDREYLSRIDKDGKATGIIYLKDEETTKPFTDAKSVFGLLSAGAGFMLSTDGALLHILAVEVIVLSILLILWLATGSISETEFKSYCKQYIGFYIPIFVALFIFVSKP